MSDLKNVVEVQSKIFDNFENLDLLINNAGIMHPPKTLSAQGYEIQFAVNHLAHMLLTLKLLPICLLYTSPSPRARTRARLPSSA